MEKKRKFFDILKELLIATKFLLFILFHLVSLIFLSQNFFSFDLIFSFTITLFYRGLNEVSSFERERWVT